MKRKKNSPQTKSSRIRKKCNFISNSEKNKTSTVSIMTDNTMPRECATIATIKMEEQKNPGNVIMKNSMPTVSVKTATSTSTTKRKDKSLTIKTSQI